MTSRRSSIVLIGMPGSGKSTIGKRLASHFGLAFIDTDRMLEAASNMPIQDIVDKRGLRYFKQLESQILCSLKMTDSVIATGGSAVYSHKAMQHLKTIGTRVYLHISLATMRQRVSDVESRGLVKLPQHSLPRLYCQRRDLFEAAADVTFDNNLPISAVRMELLQSKILQFEAD